MREGVEKLYRYIAESIVKLVGDRMKSRLNKIAR